MRDAFALIIPVLRAILSRGDVMLESIWAQSAAMPEFESLKHDIKTDVLIIGGGIAGLLCAYLLKEEGVDYALVEADRICRGVTRNTTAKITAQHGLLYDKLIRRFGKERAKMYLTLNLDALARYRALSGEIDCDFEEQDSFVFSLYDRRKLEREANALHALGFDATLEESLPLPFAVEGAVRFPGQARFHPLKFLSAIARGLNIYERTPVVELGESGGRPTAKTERAMIRAERMILATHFPILNKHGGYYLKMYQSRAYVLALEHAPDLRGMYVDEADGGLSFRNYENLLLLGGCGARTGKKSGAWQELSRLAGRFYPRARPVAQWATQDCMTLDGAPYVGRYSPGTPALYVITGFNKWGMTSAMAGAMLLRDRMLGRENPLAPAFDPQRSIWRPQLAVNAAEAAVNLLTPSVKRCPHLGCALKWNRNEQTWDCPCHGSRFTREGALLDNPATGGLKGAQEPPRGE